MTVHELLSVVSVNSVPKISCKKLETRVKVLNQREVSSVHYKLVRNHGDRSRLTRLNAAGCLRLNQILMKILLTDGPPTASALKILSMGNMMGTIHTAKERRKVLRVKFDVLLTNGGLGTFWGAIADDIDAIEPPTGFQGLISWLFLPTVAAGMFFNVPGEYLFIGAAVFTAIFCIIEMDKPDKPHHFEPQIYNMERGARDKLINDYNTMSIWDFNEKYGDLWDFTVKKDDITKR
ncbi:hypothetical protein CRYUN_Cryun40dG0039200 [Craigia yunnanensis]